VGVAVGTSKRRYCVMTYPVRLPQRTAHHVSPYAVTMMLVPFGISASTGYSVPAPCRRLSVEAVELTIAVCSPLVVGTGVNSMPTALKSRLLAST